MHDHTISTRINSELAEQIERLAAALGRNQSWIFQTALQAFVDSERQFLDSVAEGMEAYRSGRVVDHAEVVADWEQRRDRTPK